MKKKINRKFEIIWKVIGWIILILFIYSIINSKTINGILSIIILGSIVIYGIISAIIFLPSILKKFFKKLK